jgi:tRNA(adenine34) deaminase
MFSKSDFSENQLKNNEKFMRIALNLAKKSMRENEVPVGAVVVCNNKIIGCGRNRKEKLNNPILHAEIIAIENACKNLCSWRLINCDIFVTLEPCPMCAGAIINSRINKLIFATEDLKSGSVKSVINLFDLPFNHKPIVISGVLQKESSEILSNFFKSRRKNKHISN